MQVTALCKGSTYPMEPGTPAELGRILQPHPGSVAVLKRERLASKQKRTEVNVLRTHHDQLIRLSYQAHKEVLPLSLGRW